MEATSSMPASTQELIARTVRLCVEQVRHTPKTNYFEAELLKDFDAYYNPTTHIVTTYGHQKGVFLFYKCMHEKDHSYEDGKK